MNWSLILYWQKGISLSGRTLALHADCRWSHIQYVASPNKGDVEDLRSDLQKAWQHFLYFQHCRAWPDDVSCFLAPTAMPVQKLCLRHNCGSCCICICLGMWMSRLSPLTLEWWPSTWVLLVWNVLIGWCWCSCWCFCQDDVSIPGCSLC